MEDLNGLRVFLQVAESRSFTAAAQRLGLTPSGVSKAIARLEQEYGQRLLNRTTRRVGLTNDGLAFFERCRQVMADLQEAENQLTQSSALPRGHLRVQMPTAFGKKVVLPRLAQVLEQLPDLRIDVELGERRSISPTKGWTRRCASAPSRTPGSSPRLCDVRFVACARGLPGTARHAAHAGRSRAACVPRYTTPWRSHYREWSFADAAGVPRALSVSGKLNVNSAEALLEAALAGSGIAMIADFVAWEAVQAGGLRIVLADYIGPPMPVSLVYLPGRQHSPRLRWFVDALRAILPTPAPWEAIARMAAGPSQ